MNKFVKTISSRALAGLVLGASLLLTSSVAMAQPTLGVALEPDTIGPGSATRLVFEMSAPTPTEAISFTLVLPASITIASTPPSADCTAQLTAPEGGNTIDVAIDRLGGNSTCKVFVDVVASIQGVHSIPSITLASSAGSSMSLPVDLSVDGDLPGFTRSFSPSAVTYGDRATLTYIFDHTLGTKNITSLDFSDQLPAAITIAPSPNFSTTCTGSDPNTTPTVSLTPGDSFFSYRYFGFDFDGFRVMLPGATCAISFDVIVSGVGEFASASGEATISNPQQNSIGFATSRVEGLAEPIVLTQALTSDRVPPGGVTTLEVTIRNRERMSDFTALTFTEDLDAALTGLQVTGALPTDPCGAGSSLAGTTSLTLTNGSIPAGGECTFAVDLAIPATATPGVYDLVATGIQADANGRMFTGLPSTASLFVQATPVITATPTVTPVATGGTATIAYEILNPSATSGVTDLSFIADVGMFLPGTMVTLPGAGFCGPGSTLQLQYNFPSQGDIKMSMSGGSLAAGASCTFEVEYSVPEGFSGGEFYQAVGAVTGTIDGQSATGYDTIAQLDLVAAPVLKGEFVGGPAAPGSLVTLEYSLSYDENALAGATDISFTHDLEAILPGLVATGLPANDVCGVGSSISGQGTLTFSQGSIAPNSSCVFQVNVQIPANASAGSYPSITSEVSAMVSGLAVTSRPFTNDLVIQGVSFALEFTDDPAYPADDVTLSFTLDNPTTETLTNISFTHNLDDTIAGMVAVGLPINDACGAGSSMQGTSTLALSGGSLAPGASCTIDVIALLPANTSSGEYNSTTSDLFSNGVEVANPASDNLIVDNPLSTTLDIIETSARPGDSFTVEITLTNAHSLFGADAIALEVPLDAVMPGLATTSAAASDVCGAGSLLAGPGDAISLSGGSLPPNMSCSFSVDVLVPSSADSVSLTLESEAATGNLQGSPVSAREVSDSIAIELVELTKTFTTEARVGGQTTLSFNITNTSSSTTLQNISFLDDLDAMLPGAQAANLPASIPCLGGASVTGTDTIRVDRATLAPNSSCAFDVLVNIPAAATVGDYTNTTSVVLDGDQVAGREATAPLQVIEALVEMDMGADMGMEDMGMGDDMSEMMPDMGSPDMMMPADDMGAPGDDMAMVDVDMGEGSDMSTTPGEEMGVGDVDMATGADMSEPTNGGGEIEGGGCGNCATVDRSNTPWPMSLLLALGALFAIGTRRRRLH